MNKNISKTIDFCKNHPILFNLGLICIAAFIVIWIALIWLDSWTSHGKYEVVPDVKGLSYQRACDVLKSSGLYAELSDSVYSDQAQPGEVVEQIPRSNDKVKANRTIYLTVNAFSPKSVIIPTISGLSVRQAHAELESRGIRNIQIRYIPSEYKDLALGVKFNGLELKSGSKVPITATLTLEVGEGYTDDIYTDSLSDVTIPDLEYSITDEP